jgi:alpha-beta hydrolase superfamily lysophospholipase
MPFSELSYKSADGTKIVAYRWEPEDPPRAAVQITHGMGEHAMRYDHVAKALNDAGFVVYAQDHRGHGATGDPEAYGDLGEGGWPALVSDIGLLSDKIHADHPELTIILLGHSMGSFAVQQYLLDHSTDIGAVVLTGTAVLDLLEPALNLDEPLDLAAFNAPFAPARTDFDWLSRDDAQVDAYVADPWCGFGLDATAGTEMLAGGRPVADPQRLAAMRQDLPVYIAVGEHDPVGGPVVLAQLLADRYREAGLKDVTFRVWPGGRHEILNESNRDEVEGELLSWIEGAVGR